MTKKEIINILERIIRCNAITFFGYNTVAPGYKALQEAINLINKQDKAIDKMAERINDETLGDIICDEICNKNCNKINECEEEYVFVCKNCIKEYFYKEIENDKEGDLSKNKENGN